MVHVHFNDHDLSTITSGTASVTITRRDPHSLPKRELDAVKLARADGQKLVNAQYAEREIMIEGVISGGSRNDLEAVRDTILSYISAEEARLEFEQAGALRRYYCTMQDAIFSNTEGGMTNFSLKFVASDPYGYDAASTTLSGLTGNITATPTTKTTTFSGSGTQLPTITVTVTAVTGGTNATLSISNPATGQQIQVNRNWASSDVLVINAVTRATTVNGVAVAYTGSFPEWSPGAASIIYSDTFTTRTATLGATYTIRRL